MMDDHQTVALAFVVAREPAHREAPWAHAFDGTFLPAAAADAEVIEAGARRWGERVRRKLGLSAEAVAEAEATLRDYPWSERVALEQWAVEQLEARGLNPPVKARHG